MPLVQSAPCAMHDFPHNKIKCGISGGSGF